MGTNYYLIRESNSCPACGRADREQLHVGKSSGGWCFSLHVSRDDDERQATGVPRDLAGWIELFNAEGVWLEDEYGCRVDIKELINTITNRSWKWTRIVEGYGGQPPYGYESWEEFYGSNHAAPGPNGLVRHALEPEYCIGHGDGTYDLMVGEFS